MRGNAADWYSDMSHSPQNTLSLYRSVITFGRVFTWCGWLDRECLYVFLFAQMYFQSFASKYYSHRMGKIKKKKKWLRGPQHLIDCPGSPFNHSVYLWRSFRSWVVQQGLRGS